MSEPLQAAPEPVPEPIVVTLVDGQVVVVRPDEPLPPAVVWAVAYSWREKDASLQLVERERRTQRMQIAKLQDTQDAKRKVYARRPIIERWFDLWQELRGHRRSKLTPERFDKARARLEEGYEELDGMMALHGQNARPVVKDGVLYDDFELVFRAGQNIERYANLCPPALRRQLRSEAEARTGDQMELA
jgi:hypothetical protein